MEIHNFSDVEGTALKVLYVEEPPFVNNADLENDYQEGHYRGPGIIMDILKIVGGRYNLRYNFTKSPEGASYGSKQADGSWTGMIGMLQRKEVDIIATAMIVNEERKDVVDFTTAFMTTASGMLIRSPDQFVDNRFLIVTAPLDWQVWALIALAIVVSGFIFKGVSIGLRQLDTEEHFSLLDCIWIFYAIFVQQDLSRLPLCAATRTMLSFWWLASLSICGFFTGNMVALFAVSRSVLPFNTRDDMVAEVKQSSYKIVLQNTSDIRMNFIRDSGLKVFQDLWSEMNRGKWINVSTLEEGIQAVVNQPKLVFVAAKESLEALASQVCSVTTLDGDLIPVWYAIGMRKDSSLIPAFNDVINKLAENGFVDKWLHDAQMMQSYYRGTQCNTSLGAGIGTGGNIDIAGDAIPIEKAQGVFWLLVAGFCLGTACLVFELFYRLFKPQQSIDQRKHKATVRVISIASPQRDIGESIDSYRPRSIKTTTHSAVILEAQGHSEPYLAAKYGNFETSSYGGDFGAPAQMKRNDESIPHAINEDQDVVKHRGSARTHM